MKKDIIEEDDFPEEEDEPEEEEEETEEEIPKKINKLPSEQLQAKKIQAQEKEQPVQIVEREITLSLINEKLNFLIGLFTKKE